MLSVFVFHCTFLDCFCSSDLKCCYLYSPSFLSNDLAQCCLTKGWFYSLSMLVCLFRLHTISAKSVVKTFVPYDRLVFQKCSFRIQIRNYSFAKYSIFVQKTFPLIFGLYSDDAFCFKNSIAFSISLCVSQCLFFMLTTG